MYQTSKQEACVSKISDITWSWSKRSGINIYLYSWKANGRSLPHKRVETNRQVPWENHLLVASPWRTWSHIVVLSKSRKLYYLDKTTNPWEGKPFITLAVKGTDCISWHTSSTIQSWPFYVYIKKNWKCNQCNDVHT